MENKFIIRGALANIGPRVTTSDFISFMNKEIDNAEYYKLTPKSGQIMATGFDWTIIINTIGVIGGLITIADVLWKAYKHFFQENKSEGALIIEITTEKNRTEHFILGKEYKDEKTFKINFSEKVEKMISISNPKKVEECISQIINSDIWKKYE